MDDLIENKESSPLPALVGSQTRWQGGGSAPVDEVNCRICRKPLGEEPLAIAYNPVSGSAHLTCKDWTGEIYPLRHLVPTLRAFYRALPQLRRELLSAGQELAKIEKQWPGEHPAEILMAARRRRARLKEALTKLNIVRKIYALEG